MNILLINPEKLVIPPFGLLHIGSMLKAKGHEIKVLEIPYESKKNEYIALVNREIEGFRPHLVGVTCMSMQVPIAREVVKNVKERFKDLTVMVGGVHPTVDSHDVLSWGTDIAVRGEGEKTVLEIMDFCGGKTKLESIKGISYKDNGKIVDNPAREFIKDLDELPPLSYKLLDAARFKKRSYSIRGFWLKSAWIITTRGCPGRCIFCASKTMHGLAVREFGIERVLDEVERLKKEFGIQGLWIFDDTFTLKERRVVEFCEGLKMRGIKVTWACQARVDTFTENMAKAMRSSGCVQVDFGVESGSQRLLDYIKKNIKCEETRRAFKIAKDSGLRVLATVMTGLPTENMIDFAMTKRLLDEISPDFVLPTFTMPYPGTELYSMARENRWIDTSKELDWRNSGEPIMAAGMPPSEIKKAYEDLLSYDKSVLSKYLLQPLFLFDLSKVFLRHPKYIGLFLLYVMKGRKKELMDLFLYIFRKEIVND